jgi:hypothetical protein
MSPTLQGQLLRNTGRVGVFTKTIQDETQLITVVNTATTADFFSWIDVTNINRQVGFFLENQGPDTVKSGRLAIAPFPDGTDSIGFPGNDPTGRLLAFTIAPGSTIFLGSLSPFLTFVNETSEYRWCQNFRGIAVGLYILALTVGATVRLVAKGS